MVKALKHESLHNVKEDVKHINSTCPKMQNTLRSSQHQYDHTIEETSGKLKQTFSFKLVPS